MNFMVLKLQPLVCSFILKDSRHAESLFGAETHLDSQNTAYVTSQDYEHLGKF